MEKGTFKFELGARVKDVITGYKGVVGGRTQYLRGCIQYGIVKEGLTKEGTYPDWVWLDESRLMLDSESLKLMMVLTTPAGPAPSAPEC